MNDETFAETCARVTRNALDRQKKRERKLVAEAVAAVVLVCAVFVVALTVDVRHAQKTGAAPAAQLSHARQRFSTAPTVFERPAWKRELLDVPPSEKQKLILLSAQPGDLVALFFAGEPKGCFVVLQVGPRDLALAPSAECGRPKQ